MLKKLSKLGLIVSISILLSNCSAEELNTVKAISENLKSLKDVTINLNGLKLSDIEEVDVNEQKVITNDLTTTTQQINIPKLQEGKHVIRFKHKVYGYITVPIDVKGNVENNFQFNSTVADNAVSDWELGIDSNKDGTIDENSFISKQIDQYVVIQENSGQTNYLPKENFQKDFIQNKIGKKPDNFKFEGFKREDKPKVNVVNGINPPINNQPINLAPPNPTVNAKVYFPINKELPKPNIIPETRPQNVPPPNVIQNIHLKMPEKISTYKLEKVFVNEFLLDTADYTLEKGELLIKANYTRIQNSNIGLYLIDETGQGILLAIKPKSAFFAKSQPLINSKDIFPDPQNLEYILQKNFKLDSNNFPSILKPIDLPKVRPMNKPQDFRPEQNKNAPQGFNQQPRPIDINNQKQPRKDEHKEEFEEHERINNMPIQIKPQPNLPIQNVSTTTNLQTTKSAEENILIDKNKSVKVDENGEIIDYSENSSESSNDTNLNLSEI